MKKLLLLSSVMALPAFGMEKQAFQDGVREGRLQAMKEMRQELAEEKIAESAIVSQTIKGRFRIIFFTPKEKPFPQSGYSILSALFQLLLKEMDKDSEPQGEWLFNSSNQEGELKIYPYHATLSGAYSSIKEWLEEKAPFLHFMNIEELNFNQLYLKAKEDENQKKQQEVVEKSEDRDLDKEIEELNKGREKKEKELSEQFGKLLHENWK